MSRLFALLALGLGLFAVSAQPSEAARPGPHAATASPMAPVHYDQRRHYTPPRQHWFRSHGYHGYNHGYRHAPPPRHGYWR